MRRREFISLVGGAAVWPFATRAQQGGMTVIGFLSARSASGDAHLVAAFRRGLADAGFLEEKNLKIEFRWGDGRTDRLPALARDLVDRRVALLVAAGGISSVAASKATSTIPIVFISASDPMENRVVPSLNRPAGNVTGISLTGVPLAPKRVDLLLELLPDAKVIALLVNPTTSTTTPAEVRDVPAAAAARQRTVQIVNVTAESDFDAAFASFTRQGIDALVVGTDPLFVKARTQLVALAARYKIPAIYDRREFAEAGGLIAYGADIAAGYRRGGVYAGEILKGAKPASLPVEQAATFELVINVKTAKALALTVPPALLARADEVIE
jgi:putative ABC transport system substrate-binding protein